MATTDNRKHLRKINRSKQRKIYKMVMTELFYHDGYLPGYERPKDDYVGKKEEEYNRLTAIRITDNILSYL